MNRFQTFEKASSILPPALPTFSFGAYCSCTDMNMALDKIVPEDLNWLHTDEGPE